MHHYPELELARDDMMSQTELYRPTAFWEEAALRITRELSEHGIGCFRSLPSTLDFFVPTYGAPGNGLSKEQSAFLLEELQRRYPQSRKSHLAMSQFLNGELAAQNDYRVLLAADDEQKAPHLHGFSESAFGAPAEQFEFDGRRFSRSSLNYLLGLALLKRHLGDDLPRVVLEVGGGFGTLGEILFSSGVPDVRYIDIDIPPTSFVAQHYLSSVLGPENVATYAQTRSSQSIDMRRLPAASVLCSWQIERLQGKVDLFVNFISFQEMEPLVVRNYLGHVDRLGARWVLLRNIREGKQVRKGPGSVGVCKPIVTGDYLEMLPGYRLVSRNVLPFGTRTVDGFHSELLLLRRNP